MARTMREYPIRFGTKRKMFSDFSCAGSDLEGDLIAPFCARADRDLVVAIVPMYVGRCSLCWFEIRSQTTLERGRIRPDFNLKDEI